MGAPASTTPGQPTASASSTSVVASANTGLLSEEQRTREKRRGDLWLLVIRALSRVCAESRAGVAAAGFDGLQQALLAAGAFGKQCVDA
jgi:hypothetical protein